MNIEKGKISNDRLLAALAAAKLAGGTICTLWSFPPPETSLRSRQRLLMHFASFSVGRLALKPITYYGIEDPGTPVEITPIAFHLSDRFMARVIELRKKIERLCDSIAVYHKDTLELLLFIVFHENLIGTKDKTAQPGVVADLSRLQEPYSAKS